MKDHIRGAFQALAWVRMILANVKDLPGLEEAIAQIDEALDKVREAAAKDFKKDVQAEIKSKQN